MQSTVHVFRGRMMSDEQKTCGVCVHAPSFTNVLSWRGAACPKTDYVAKLYEEMVPPCVDVIELEAANVSEGTDATHCPCFARKSGD